MTITRLPTSLISTGSQNAKRLRTIFLASVTSSVLLMGSLGVARADDVDNVLNGVKLLELSIPTGSLSQDTQTEVTNATKLGDAYATAVKQQNQAQTDLTNANATKAAAQSDYNAASQAYQPQADAVARAKDALDNTILLYKTSTPQQALTKAVNEYNTQNAWLQKASASLAIANKGQAAFDAAVKAKDPAVAGYTDYTKFKTDATAGYNNAMDKTNKAQWAAQAAADVAKAANVTSASVIAKAQADYDAAKTKLDVLNKTKNDAGTRLQNADASITSANTALNSAKASVADVKTKLLDPKTGAVKAINDANADVVKFQNNQAAAAAKPSAPGLAVTTPAAGSALVGNSGGTLVGNAGGTLVGNAGGTVLSHDGGTLISNNNTALIGKDQAGLTGKNQAGIVTDQGAGLISDKGAGLISEHGAGLISEHGAGVISQDNAGLTNSNMPAGFTMKGAGVSAYSAASQTPDPTSQLSDAQKAATAAQAASTSASSAVSAAQAAVNDAQAKVDALNKTFSGAKSAGAALTAAVNEYNNQKGWLDKASASLAIANKGQAAFDAAVKAKDPAVAGYTDYAKFKADATSGYNNALDKTNKAQYVAQVAADVVKDPKNGLAPLQKANGDLQAAQQDLKTKQQASSDAAAKLTTANANVKAAQDNVARQAASQASKQPAPPALATPSTPGVALATASSGSPATTAPPIAAAPVISNDGGSLKGSAPVISNDGGSLIGKDQAGLIGKDQAGLIGKDQAGLIGKDQAGLTGKNQAGIVTDQGAGLISDKGAGLISEHGAGLANSNMPAGFTMKGAGVSAYSASSPTPDPKLNDAQKAVDDAQAKVDALNKTFSGAKSAGAALTAAVNEYNTQKGWLDKASASLAVANKGQAAFDAAVKAKDPAVAGYTDYAKFKADATAGYNNALDKTNKAQYAAQVAADNVKDPKNGLAQLQAANQTLQDAQKNLASAKASATVSAQQQTKPSGGTPALATPSTPGNVAVIAPPAANSGSGLISNSSNGVISTDNASVVGHNASAVINQDNAGVVGHNASAVIGNDGHSLISNASNGVLTDNGMLATGNKIISDHSEGLISEHGAGAIAQSSALLASLPAAGARQVSASSVFKQDSVITANANITTPDQDLKNAVGKLSAQDNKTLSDLKAQVASGKPLTADQASQVSAISDKIAKNMDPANVKSLQASIATKSGTSTGSPASSPATMVAAAPSGTTAPNPATGAPVASTAAPSSTAQVAADLKGLSPAALQQLVKAGPAVVQGLQDQQKAALAKGDKTTADALGKDIVNVQAQIAYAKTQPAAASAPATPATAAPQVASVKPEATAPATSPSSGSTPSKPAEVKTEPEIPAKLTADQGKAVQQALRTIPGKLNKSEQKQFDNLSTLVDKATGKGLTPQEATELKAGLAALADKHPKAEKQHGLSAIGNAIARRGEERPALAIREGGKPEPGKPVAAPPMMESKGTPPTATTPDKSKSIETVKLPEHKGPDARPEQAIARTNPTAAVTPPAGEKKETIPEHHVPNGTTPVAHANPAAPVTPPAGEKKETIPEHHMPNGTTPVAHANPTAPSMGGGAGERKEIPEHHMNIPEHHENRPPQPPKQAFAPAPKPATPPAAAPRPAMGGGAAPPKPAAPPAAKSCRPNMVGGKMMGMICS